MLPLLDVYVYGRWVEWGKEAKEERESFLCPARKHCAPAHARVRTRLSSHKWPRYKCSTCLCVLCAPCTVCTSSSLVPAAKKPSQRDLRFGTRVDQDAATIVLQFSLASSPRNSSGRNMMELPLARLVGSTPNKTITSNLQLFPPSANKQQGREFSARQSKASHSNGPIDPPGAQVLPLLAVWAVFLSALYRTVRCSAVPPCAVPDVGTGWVPYVLYCMVPVGTWRLNPVLRTASRIQYLALHRPALDTWATPTNTITPGPARLLLIHHNSTTLPTTTTNRVLLASLTHNRRFHHHHHHHHRLALSPSSTTPHLLHEGLAVRLNHRSSRHRLDSARLPPAPTLHPVPPVVLACEGLVATTTPLLAPDVFL